MYDIFEYRETVLRMILGFYGLNSLEKERCCINITHNGFAVAPVLVCRRYNITSPMEVGINYA